jgi:outer membrane protein
MKKMVAAMVLAGWAFCGMASADDKPKIGYVDLRQVLIESNAGKQHKAAMEKVVKEKQGMLEAEEKKLQAQKEGYEKDQLTYSETQKRTKQRDLQDKYQALQETANDAQKELRQKDSDYTGKAVKDIKSVIAEVAKEEKTSLVFEKTEVSVLYAEDGMDLTPKVMQKYNAKFPGK